MQQVTSRPQANPNLGPINGGNSRSTIIVVLALLLFALSGLMAGFTTGAFTRSKQTAQTQANKSKLAAVSPTAATHQQTPIANTTATPEVTGLGYPLVTQFSYPEMADSTTNYTISAYPVDQSIDIGHGKQIHVADITCKVWLTKDENANATLRASKNKLESIDMVKSVLPTEIDNGLNFTSTSQTQMCSANGPTTWTYTVSSSIEQGKYFLVILSDWEGIRYNWNTLQINVVKKGS